MNEIQEASITVAEARRARGRSAKSRGKTYERQFVAYLREQGWPDARRAVVTGSRERHDPGDIAGTPGIVWDVKSRIADLARQRTAVAGMLAAVAQMAAGEDAGFGFLVERFDRRPVSEWRAWMGAGVALRLLTAQSGARMNVLSFPLSMAVGDVVALLHVRGLGEPVNPFGAGL